MLLVQDRMLLFFISGAFLFALLLGFLAALFICVLAISLVCGKRAAVSRETRKQLAIARKAEENLKRADRTFLRSPSVSSLPTATLIHPLPMNHEENDGVNDFAALNSIK